MASWLEWEVIYFLNSRIWMFREVCRIMPLALLMKSQILLLLHKKIQWNLEEEFLSLSLSTYLAFSFLRFSQTCEFWSSKANWRLHFSLPSIILTDLLGNKTLLHGFKRSWFVICGFRSILCVSVFQGLLLVIVIMIDGSEKHSCEGGFWTLEFACLWKGQ